MEASENNVISIAECIEYSNDPILHADRLRDLYNWQMKNNPKLKGKKMKDVALGCLMSETCLKNLLSGKNDNPTLDTVKRLLRFIGGGDLNVLVGFAPARDFDAEEKTYDGTLMASMEARLEEKREQVADLKAQLEDAQGRLVNLRTIIHEEGKDGNAAKGKVKEMEERLADKRAQIERYEKQIDEQKAEIRKLRFTGGFVGVLLVVALLIVIYLLWEMANPNLGNFRY